VEDDTKQRTKKQRENFKLKTRRKRTAGWTGMKGKKWNATVGTYLGGVSGLICMDDGSSAPSVLRPAAEQKR